MERGQGIEKSTSQHGKDKVSMVNNATMVSTRETGKYPCSICHKGVGSNPINYNTVKFANIVFTRSQCLNFLILTVSWHKIELNGR